MASLEELWLRAKDKVNRLVNPKAYASEKSLDYTNAVSNATSMNQGQPATQLPGQIIPVYNPPYGPTRQDMVTTPPPATNTTQTTTDNTGGTGGTGGIDALLASAQAKLNALRSGASNAYNTAKDYVSQGLGKLGEKRGQFQNLFSEGQGDIAQGYSKEAGSAGRTAEAQRTTAANSARAMGTGGSYLQGLTNRVNDALARTLASVGQSRSQNERSNRDLLGERMDWATSQEQGLNNYLRQAADKKAEADSLSAANFTENLGGIDQLIANLGNLSAPSTSDYGTYGTSKAGINWSNILNSLNGLNLGGGTSSIATADTANPVSINPVLADLLKRRAY